MPQNYFYPPGDAGNLVPATPSPGAATAANQVIEINELTSIDSKTPPLGQATMANSSPVVIASDQSRIPVYGVSDGDLGLAPPNATATLVGGMDGSGLIQGLTVDAGNQLYVTAAPSSPVSTLDAVDGLHGAPEPTRSALMGGRDPAGNLIRPVTVNSTGNLVVAVTGTVPLPTGAATEATLAAFSAKTAGALVPAAFDYQAITYVGATTDVNTVTYKTGGAGGTTVATLTMAYDGSDRLISVTKT